ncbi:MAG TPA: hypothetical protein VKQ32_25405 [Polyangia bacterium]|nr:hypothetical protein [Polyangia bacterium]
MAPRVRVWWRVGLLVAAAALAAAGLRMLQYQGRAREQVKKLERLPFMVNGWDRPTSEPAAQREQVIIARLDMQGATIFRTGPVSVARSSKLLDTFDAQLPTWPARDEVRAALAGNRTFGRYWTPDRSVLIQTLAQPVPEGGALYILTGMYVSKSEQPANAALFMLIVVVALFLMRLIEVTRSRSRRRSPGPGP